MTAYLKRLVSSLAAYQVADVVSKFIAVLLLPVYTRYIDPAGYGVVELLANGVILISILVRFGMIESFLRFYFADADQARRDALARRAAGFLLVTHHDRLGRARGARRAAVEDRARLPRSATIFRIAVLGLWAFTNLELAYALLRVDERLRTYATASLINVGLTIGASLALVVVLGQGARGLLLGNYGASTVVLLGLWWTMRDRLLPRHHPGCRGARRAAPVRAADGPGRGVGVRAQHRRPLLHLPPRGRRPEARRPVLDRGQAGRRGRVHRARVPVRLAAARVLGPR